MNINYAKEMDKVIARIRPRAVGPAAADVRVRQQRSLRSYGAILT